MRGTIWMETSGLIVALASTAAAGTVATGDVQGQVPAGPGPLWVENRGQWPESVEFVTEAAGAWMRAERGALALDLEEAGERRLVRIDFEGANDEARWVGVDAIEGRFHYYIGNDPDAWVTNARAFTELRCPELYPGIELVLRSQAAGLKYDLLVAPGAQLDHLRLRCDGGDLALLSQGAAADLFPLAQRDGPSWQVLPDGGTRQVECTWRESEPGLFEVECAERDPSLPLVIDPELLWSSYLGSPSPDGQGDGAYAVSFDPDGNVVVVGRKTGPGFPRTPDAVQFPGNHAYHAFATKMRASDGALMYSCVFGGSSAEQLALAVVQDAEGRAVVAGYTGSPDFPVTRGAMDTTPTAWNTNGFLLKLSARGDELLFCSYLGGDLQGECTLWAVDLDSQGNILVGGEANADYPTTSGVPGETYGGGIKDGVVAKINPTGSQLLWSTYLGGDRGDFVYGLEVGLDDSVTVTGRTISVDFPTTPGAFMTVKPYQTSQFGFVTRIASDGSELVWSSFIGGSGVGTQETTSARAIALDAMGSATITGITSTHFPTTPGAFLEDPPNVSGGGFVARFLPDGSDLVYGTYLGSLGGGSPESVAVDASGIATVTGPGPGSFPTTPGSFDPIGSQGASDIFVTRMSPFGDRLFYSTFLAGTTTDTSEGVTLTAGGRVVVVGQVVGPGAYPTTPDAPFPNYVGGQADAVISVLDLLLDGVSEHGVSQPSCLGPLRIGVTELAIAGRASFSIYASGAPPEADGWLLVSHAAAPWSAPQADPHLLVDPARLLTRIPVRSDAFGFCETPFPLATSLADLELHFQYFFTNPPHCTGPTRHATTPRLQVRVQAP